MLLRICFLSLPSSQVVEMVPVLAMATRVRAQSAEEGRRESDRLVSPAAAPASATAAVRSALPRQGATTTPRVADEDDVALAALLELVILWAEGVATTATARAAAAQQVAAILCEMSFEWRRSDVRSLTRGNKMLVVRSRSPLLASVFRQCVQRGERLAPSHGDAVSSTRQLRISTIANDKWTNQTRAPDQKRQRSPPMSREPDDLMRGLRDYPSPRCDAIRIPIRVSVLLEIVSVALPLSSMQWLSTGYQEIQTDTFSPLVGLVVVAPRPAARHNERGSHCLPLQFAVNNSSSQTNADDATRRGKRTCVISSHRRCKAF